MVQIHPSGRPPATQLPGLTEPSLAMDANAMTVDLAVVIVTYNSASEVGQLLDSLADALDGLTADVVVVDNGSVDDTVALLEGRPDCRVVRSTNDGYAAAINRGVRAAAKSEAILVANPDLIMTPDSAGVLVDALRRSGAGIVAPRILNADGSLEESLRREPSIPRAIGLSRTGIPLLAECLMRPGEYDVPRIVDWALGAALVISRACFDAVGGWDESYFLYSEETEFCLRARDLGFVTRYEPRAVVTHLAGRSGRNVKTQAMLAVNRVRLYRRRHSAPASAIYFALVVLREIKQMRCDDGRHRAAVAALLRPALRPAELNCSDRLLPG